mmetsp:Transcript_34951/g.96623  ORF Transcript_34951/g.96623 Transcript_34951/m.96623 type:complete len:136 (-) Transcript_34951:586-993(-)
MDGHCRPPPADAAGLPPPEPPLKPIVAAAVGADLAAEVPFLVVPAKSVLCKGGEPPSKPDACDALQLDGIASCALLDCVHAAEADLPAVRPPTEEARRTATPPAARLSGEVVSPPLKRRRATDTGPPPAEWATAV